MPSVQGAPLLLVSSSPQRKAILDMLGISYRQHIPDVDELAEGDPREVVIENARRKVGTVLGGAVLGVDTTVAADGVLYGKPADAGEAAEVLRVLSGRTHEVWSGLVLRSGGEERASAAVTRVRFRQLDDAWIDWYVATEEWRGRAGGYAIQGRGAALVESIEGDYWNVVGLPVAELVALAPELVLGTAQL